MDKVPVTFVRSDDGTIVIKKGWPPADISPATSLSRAALLALNWADGGCAGQLDSEDISSYLETILRVERLKIPTQFVNSPNLNVVLTVFGKSLYEKAEILPYGKKIFAFIDTYKQKILENRGLLENITREEAVEA